MATCFCVTRDGRRGRSGVISGPLLCDDEDYDAAERLHWRPRLPTQRTRTLLARAGLAIPTPAPRLQGKVSASRA